MKFRPRIVFLGSILTLALAASSSAASLLPGFRLEKVASAEGFITSIAFDPHGRLWYSVTEGGIYVVERGKSRLLTELPTATTGNAVLLGIAFRGDEIIAHYVRPDFTADVISSVDPDSGEETILASLVCAKGNACSSEHHGGNPVVAADGSIYVGIGDYGGGHVAQLPDSPGGKIWRIDPEGKATEYAIGFRNPFDLAIHPSGEFLLVADNGPEGEDELARVRPGQNHGWPATMGNQPAMPGMTAPDYVFPGTVAPTGVALIRGLLPGERVSLLVGGFVTKALYLFPDIDADALEPVIVFDSLPALGPFPAVLDVAQDSSGAIFVASPGAIFRLIPPHAGDVNGDGIMDGEDLEALAWELIDGDGPSILEIHGGEFAATWGADVNADGIVDASDLVAWVLAQRSRGRVVRRE